MITIEENKSKKLPGGTSLYITFDYNNEIIKTIKFCCDVYNYDKEPYRDLWLCVKMRQD